MKENNQKNILFLVSNIKVGGGAERVATKIASAFSGDTDFKTQLLTFYDFYDKTYDCDAEYFSLKEAPKSTILGKIWKALTQRLWGVYKHCRQYDIDTVIAFLPEASVYAILAGFLPGNDAKVIVSVRVNPLHKSRLYKAFYRYLYPFADRVVAVSKGVQKILEDEFGLTNVSTIYNPVNIERMREQAKEPIPEEHQHFFAGDGPVFINVGRMSKQKGQWHLIRAFSEVVKENPEARLVILGDGELRPKLERLAGDCRVDDKVYMPGKVSNVFPYLKASDCFVFTSLWEGLPNALLEALAVGLPVISTDCKTGPREIFVPDARISKIFSYPREEQGRILINELSDEINLDQGDMSKSELMLVEGMISLAEETSSDLGVPKKNRFNVEVIESEWKRILNQ